MTSTSPEQVKSTKAKNAQKQHRRKPGQIALLAVGAGAGIVVLSLVLLPTIVANTPLKDLLLSAAFADKDVDVTIAKLRVSWFAPTEVHDLRLTSKLNESKAVVPKVTTDASLFGWLLQASTSKSIEIEGLDLLIDVDASGENVEPVDDHQPGASGFGEPIRQINFALRDAQISIQGENLPQPTVILENLAVQGQLLRENDQTRVVVQPGQVTREKQVSAELCDAALKYVAPIVAETTWAKGALSVELDKWELTLGDPYATTGSGTLTIHSLETGLKSPLALKISTLISNILNAELPTTVKLATNSTVQFSMQHGKVRHEGLEFGLPEVSSELLIRTSGTVGLDETLDLIVEVPLPLHLLGDGPVLQALGSQTLHLPVRGTLDEPIVEFEGDGQLVSNLLAGLSEKAVDGELDLQKLFDQLRELRQQRDPNEPTLLDRWREQRDQRGRVPLFRRRFREPPPPTN